MPNPSIKDEKLYQDLRNQGNSADKAARISNAAAVPELKKRAKQLGISGYSSLTKDKLISKLRNH
jgi:hypothetical protein